MFEILFEFLIPFLLGYGLPTIALIVLGTLVYTVVRTYRNFSAQKGNTAGMRMEKTRFVSRILFYLIVPVAILCLVLGLMSGLNGENSLGLMLAGGAGMYGLSKLYQSRYNKDFKDNFVIAELEKTFDDVDFRINESFSLDEISHLDLFTSCGRVLGNDRLTATYKGLPFVQSDIKVDDHRVSESTDEDGDRVVEHIYTPVFRGRVMRFVLRDAIPGPVQIIRRDFSSAKRVAGQNDWHRIETELAAFAGVFEIFSRDPLDAMRVMTPQMIEAMYLLNQKINVPLAFHFEGDHMYVLMALTRDAFDVSGNKNIREERELLEQDMALITDFLDNMYFKGHDMEASASADAAGAPLHGNPAGAAVAAGGVAAGVATGVAAAGGAAAGAAVAGGLFVSLPIIGSLLSKLSSAGLIVHGPIRVLCRIAEIVPLLAWLALSIAMLMDFPDTICLSSSTRDNVVTVSSPVSTIALLLVFAAFNIPLTIIAGSLLSIGLATFLLGAGQGFSRGMRIRKLLWSLCRTIFCMGVVFIQDMIYGDNLAARSSIDLLLGS